MSKQSNHKNQDQANELKELFNAEENVAMTSETEELEHQVDLREIDVLNLPPRKEVHTNNKRTKLKISRPFLRLTVISLLIIAVLIAALYFFDGEIASLLNEL